jgi:hypothetical protein
LCGQDFQLNVEKVSDVFHFTVRIK